MYVKPNLELPLVVGDLAVLGERRRFARPSTSGRVSAIEPVEHVEGFKVGGQIVARGHLEGLDDPDAQPLVGDVLLRKRAPRNSRSSTRLLEPGWRMS